MKKQGLNRLALLLAPIVKAFNRVFTSPFSVKEIKGIHYYIWRDKIKSGTVFLTETKGAGSNVINPSKVNHAGLYYGKGLKTALTNLTKKTDEIAWETDNRDVRRELLTKSQRLKKVIHNYYIKDDVAYVIEAVGDGIVPTDLVTFFLTKDYIKGTVPSYLSEEQMKQAAEESLNSIGLPYDYGFSEADDTKYCFELCADAYNNIHGTEKVDKLPFKFLWFDTIHIYLSECFEVKGKWDTVFDSRKILEEYKEYKIRD